MSEQGKWKRVKRELLIKNPWWTYFKDVFQMPNGYTGTYHVVHTRGSAMVVAQSDAEHFLLVKQYRYLNNRFSIEFPCGGLKEGQSYKEAAQAEFEEESGYGAKKWTELGAFNPFNGVTDEQCAVFFASETYKIEQAKAADATEEIELLFLTAAQIEEKICTGELWDGMTLAAWQLYQCKMNRQID